MSLCTNGVAAPITKSTEKQRCGMTDKHKNRGGWGQLDDHGRTNVVKLVQNIKYFINILCCSCNASCYMHKIQLSAETCC